MEDNRIVEKKLWCVEEKLAKRENPLLQQNFVFFGKTDLKRTQRNPARGSPLTKSKQKIHIKEVKLKTS